VLAPCLAALAAGQAAVQLQAQRPSKRRLRAALVFTALAVAAFALARTSTKTWSSTPASSLVVTIQPLPPDAPLSPALASLRAALDSAAHQRAQHLAAAQSTYAEAHRAEQEGLDFATARHHAALQPPAELDLPGDAEQRQRQAAYDAAKERPDKDFALLAQLQGDMRAHAHRAQVRAAQAQRGAAAAVKAHQQGAARRLRELEVRLAAEAEAHDERTQSLEAQVLLQEALDAAVAAKRAELKAAEGAEAWVKCAQLQRELEAMPKTIEVRKMNNHAF
jgi:hypothetical protein